ncbi:uncharacterized protein LOC106166785 [Lingula anatina]|uniref:Uncharacterized protein LOC106166785 n=1 Tax=Lingula anatina TaxID=7574 RepID=A0A1S3IRQ9_LINAN|nr:uncharacterized protein LOC106166785 [Lingula anatina]|eukprot:XP_013400900.1 uncharacterized protein LOC106166785 [Lingula anatina]
MSLTYDARILWANVSAVYNEGEDAGACAFLHSYATEYRRDVMLDDAAERNRCGIAITKEEDSLVHCINVVAQVEAGAISIGDHHYRVCCVFQTDDHSRVVGSSVNVEHGPSLESRQAGSEINSGRAHVTLSVKNMADELVPTVRVGDQVHLQASLRRHAAFQGIRVINCTAYPSLRNPSPSRVLTKEDGCGTGRDLAEMEGFTPLEHSSARAMSAPFYAFKFTGYSDVYFRCLVALCADSEETYCTTNAICNNVNNSWNLK